MNADSRYDVAIIGGGLAGLALSIQCVRAGYSVILFEKEKYPFHKVCGEYISLEAWNFLESLGLPLSSMNLPLIRSLLVSAPNGNWLKQELPLGGFGISRYRLDEWLAETAKKAGVTVMENTKVEDAGPDKDIFFIQTAKMRVHSRLTAGTFGKRSNLDVKWKRNFILKKSNRLNNWIGVKYHIRTNFPADTIALHNFSNGYCGISRVEDGKYCLCYLTTADNLKRSGNSIPEMERTILSRNPFLKKILSENDMVYESPLTISQISFEKKSLVENHLLMTGDAAGMITPLCGNGMSMALHGSQILFKEADRFLKGQITRSEMERNYSEKWKSQFSRRLRTGRIIQRFFGNPLLSNWLITGLKPFPGLVKKLIRSTHGQPF